jgi:hypothetical protein
MEVLTMKVFSKIIGIDMKIIAKEIRELGATVSAVETAVETVRKTRGDWSVEYFRNDDGSIELFFYGPFGRNNERRGNMHNRVTCK